MCISGTATRAQAASTGSITGTVTGGNGAVITIKVYAWHGGKREAGSSATTQRRRRPTAVATATTNASGGFTIGNLPDGEYIVVAILKGTGFGHAKADLTGASVSVNITLEAHKSHKTA
jgi:hypothetical protein